MKRKRSPTKCETRSRPFQLRVELLNECLCLTLKYNIEFGFVPTDLTLYRHAETILCQNDLVLFISKVKDAISSRQELTSI